MSYSFNPDLGGTYGRKFYAEEYSFNTVNCTSEFWFREYMWENFDYTWVYDNSTRTIKITFPEGTFGDGQFHDFVIESFSPSEMVIQTYTNSFGYPFPVGRIVLR